MAELPNTKEQIFPMLKNFNYYFLKKIEDYFKSCRDVLEGIGTSTGNSDTVVNKETAFSLSELVYFHGNNKEVARKILIKAAYEIFTCYEMQFVQLTCNGGPTRAVQKLGYDAGQRFLNYCSVNKVKEIGEALVIKSIVYNTSNLLGSLGITRSCGTVRNPEENSWKIAKIYTKVGVYDKENATCYKSKGSNTKKYGHRLKFSYESVGDWEQDDLTYCDIHVTDLNDFEEDYPKIMEYIIGRDPEEYAKFDREVKHEQTLRRVSEAQNALLEDGEVKHREIRGAMVKLQDDLKGEGSKHHEAVTKILEDIKATTENILTELPKEPPPAYTIEPTVEEERKVLNNIEKEIKQSLRNFDPTSRWKRSIKKRL